MTPCRLRLPHRCQQKNAKPTTKPWPRTRLLIDAFSGLTSAQVDGVTTVTPGDPAVVTASVIGNVLHLSFAIPQGAQGLQGIQGQPGNPGNDGPQGPPFANAVIDSVTTLPAGSTATVSVMFDGANVRFTFGLPAGADGTPGEVSNAQLTTAIDGTSSNTNAVSTLDTPFANDPPTLADLEVMRAKMNEFILAARRAALPESMVYRWTFLVLLLLPINPTQAARA